MKRTVTILALLVSALAPTSAFALTESDAPSTLTEDEAIDQAIAAAEKEALSPPVPLAVRKDKPLVTAPPPEGLGIGAKLGICALVAGAAFWLIRARYAARGSRAATNKPGNKPHVLSRTPIGLRHEVVVIEVEGQRFLLGVAPGSIASLGLLPDEPVYASAAPERERAPERDRGRDRGRIVSDDADDLPFADSLSRLIAATREARPAAGRVDPRIANLVGEGEDRPTYPTASPRTSGYASASQLERARAALRDEELDAPPRPARPAAPAPTPAPRKRTSRPGATANDTSPEGQVRGLSARRAAP